jgi:hypothetical protein
MFLRVLCASVVKISEWYTTETLRTQRYTEIIKNMIIKHQLCVPSCTLCLCGKNL